MASAHRGATLGKALCLPPPPRELPKLSWATVENIIGAHACLVRRHREMLICSQQAGRVCLQLSPKSELHTLTSRASVLALPDTCQARIKYLSIKLTAPGRKEKG